MEPQLTPLETLTAGIDLMPIATAMSTVFLGMIGVGIFLKGGQMIARRLGWSA
jgi:hypothetical protein